MDKKIVWWQLIEHLTKHLQKAGIDKSLPIYAGTKASARTYPCVEVTWDHESLGISNAGFASIWIDICLKTDSKDPADAYKKQYDYQTKIIDALNAWPRQLIADTGIATKMVVDDIVSDGDIQRPVSMSRVILSIDWRVQNGY